MRTLALSVALVLAAAPPPSIARASSGGQTAPSVRIAINARALQPGELVLVRLTVPAEATAATVYAFGRTFPAYDAGAAWQALVAIDLEQSPGAYVIDAEAQLDGGVLRGMREIEVHPKRFRTRTLRVAPKYVEPPPEVALRIAGEAEFLAGVYGSSAASRYWSLPFTRPVPHRANSVFGSRSVFNGQPRAPHAGTDFASPSGTPVKAPNAGLVVAARDLFFTGNTVIIDHGFGVQSVLAHLSRVDVEEGELVSAGDEIGLVGATGRVTGPHLHWTLRVAGARVDPLSALAMK